MSLVGRPFRVASSAAEIAFVPNPATIDTNLTTYTFSSQSLGDAAADRKIVIGVAGYKNPAPSVSSMTVGGETASLVKALSGSSGEQRIELWQADVPTGTTGAIVVTWSGEIARCGIGVVRIVGAGTGPSAASDTASNAAASGANASVSLDVPENGVAVAAVMVGGNIRVSFSGLTEAYDENLEIQGHAGALDAFDTEQTGLTITATPASSTINTMVAAAWGPA